MSQTERRDNQGLVRIEERRLPPVASTASSSALAGGHSPTPSCSSLARSDVAYAQSGPSPPPRSLAHSASPELLVSSPIESSQSHRPEKLNGISHDQQEVTSTAHHGAGHAQQPMLEHRRFFGASAAQESRENYTTHATASQASGKGVLVKSDTQPERVVMPRTSSIDSTISSVSAHSHPRKSSFDVKDSSLEEIRLLIEKAGSPDNLIQHLLKEKNNTISQNAQLWRLVDKQRALLLGLNKDLERMNKEKDRYRRRVKELETQATSQPLHMIRKDSQSPVPHDTARNVVAGEKQILGQNTPGPKTRADTASSPFDPAMMPSPLHLQQQEAPGYQSISEQIDSDSSQEDPDHPVVVDEILPAGSIGKKSSDPRETQDAIPPNSIKPETASIITSSRTTPKLQTLVPPSLALIEPSPLGEKSGRSFSAARKAPAPLNLKQNNGSVGLAESIAEEKDAAYGEGLVQIDESPKPGRGRKKTREEDDRDRELVALKEQEARSLSKKEERSKSRAEENEQEAHLALPSLPASGLPISPRLPPASLQNHLAPPINLATQSQSLDGTITERSLIAPLKSPGLPTSPRPADRPLGSPLPRHLREHSGLSGSLPLSPRSGVPGMTLSPRAPKHAIPLPPGSQNASADTFPLAVSTEFSATPSKPSSQDLDMGTVSPSEAPQIFRGLVSLAYPDLLLPPNALPSIEVKVASSRLRPSGASNTGLRAQEDTSVFSLSVFSRANRQELWRVEKTIIALPQLDQALRPLCSNLPRLPERRLFNGHAPAVMDARRNSVDVYFEELLDTPMDEPTASVICRFLSTNTIDPQNESRSISSVNTGQTGRTNGSMGSKPTKAGYLTKRGKNFGGWKSRFYVLDSPELRCHDVPDGQHLSTIKLLNAQIGKQSQAQAQPVSNDEADENQYRHAFLILEPKKKDSNSLVRHVLCAESDEERDEWVEALLHYVNEPPSLTNGAFRKGDEVMARNNSDDSVLKSVNYADTQAGASPAIGLPISSKARTDPTSPESTSSPVFPNQSVSEQGYGKPITISGPMNGAVISDAGLWGNKSAGQIRDQKKRHMFHFKQRPSTDSATSSHGHGNVVEANAHGHSTESLNYPPVFGLPLAEAVELCPPVGVNVNLPAVAYRCIEYLRAKNAANEEGLFRLSGSNVVLRALKERFNNEGDVDFLSEDHYYDVHAIASLFKTYLRELPSMILTRELHLDFLHVLELEDVASKIASLNTLVHRLPSVNYSLLRTLSQYLLEVVQNSERNKMNVRNVGIVFSPTVNIPAPVFSMFLTDFNAIFEETPIPDKPRQVDITITHSLSPDDIRSPRRQMFTDLPTPAYNQTSFANSPSPSAFSPVVRGQPAVSTVDVGFTPIQPTYDSRSVGQFSTSLQPPQPYPQPNKEPAYGSLNRMIAPDNAPNAKAKRRESSMLFM